VTPPQPDPQPGAGCAAAAALGRADGPPLHPAPPRSTRCVFWGCVAWAGLLLASLTGTPFAQPAAGADARPSSAKQPAAAGPSSGRKSSTGRANARDTGRTADEAGADAAPARSAVRDPARLQAEQRQLQTQLARVKKALASAEAAQSEATDALAASESAISDANRRLRELRAARAVTEKQVAAVRERQFTAASHQSQEQVQLGQVLRAQLVRTSESDGQILLRGDDPAAVRRDRAYLAYVALAKAQAIGELQDRRDELSGLETEARERQDELRRIADAERRHKAELVAGQAERKRQVDRLVRQIGRHRDSVAALERDDRRLSGLIDQLARERVTRPQRGSGATAQAPGTPYPTTPPALPTTGRFAQLRGKLPLPVNGQIAARFGAVRAAEGGGTTWKGLFLKAATGTEVRAVAAGRVVFADWLRGFGNLLILDHGEGFLTVYGYNESLLRAVGETVDSGDVISTIGDTGGGGESGLYFEARYEGHPFDPLLWTAAR
jgi:septal ring factor EnvC (AmiA/AmiB activator)